MEVYLGWALVWVWVWLALLATRSWWRSTANHGLRLPPGPWTLPIIGSLHHLAGKLPHCALRDLARRHGPVMLLRLGEVPTLVISSPAAAREVLKTQDPAFASRSLTVTMRVVTCDGRDIIFSPYGEYWRQLRKVAVTELLTMRRVRSFRAIREEEVATMLHHVERAAAAGTPMDMRTRLSAIVSDTTFRAVMGDRCKQRDVFLRELDSLVSLTSGLNPVDLWPSSWIARLLSGDLRRAKKNHAVVFQIIREIVQEHFKGSGEEAEDLVDVLLKVHKDGGVDMLGVEAVIFDLFSAGSETSATTLEWAMAEMIKNPTVMKRATAEVRRAFEAGGKVVEDRLGADLPYLQLVVRETLRLHPPLPLLLPRQCRQPCKVLGFDVPEGTQVIVNGWALGRDERSWPDATEEFRPERFEAGDGADFRGTDFEFLPFGAGRRMCPGMAFGLANVELPLASLLLHFDWEAPGISDPAEFDMTEGFGVTARRKATLLLRPSLRVPTPRTGLVS
ncbi:zealexin A1 synthase-like [Lolium rigidum]|uniref:zealexin A1 synthase-like n=1 Tax=Lolium rigidum TaxID=89674 RepID=UPI001F5D9A5D|nr:zealexin A1 synthase-like [Lolium rigidum]